MLGGGQVRLVMPVRSVCWEKNVALGLALDPVVPFAFALLLEIASPAEPCLSAFQTVSRAAPVGLIHLALDRA